MATAFSEDDYDDYTGRIGPDGEPERYSTMLGGDPRLAQQRELASRAQRLAEPIIIDNWLKSITKDARGTEAASQVTLTPGVEYRIRDFTGRNDGQIIASGSTPEELLRLQDAAQALARQGTRADYRLEQVGGPAVGGFQTYTDPDTGKTVQVIGGDLYNKPIASTIAEIAIPVALAVVGGIYLAPQIAATAAGKATALGLAAGSGIGSTAGNLLVGKPVDQALISGLTTAATAFGGAGLGPLVNSSSPFVTGIGAAGGNLAANVATGKSLEDSLSSAALAGVTAGVLDALTSGGGNTGKPGPGEINAAKALGVDSAPGYSLNTVGQLTGPAGNVISLAAAKAALASGVPIAGVEQAIIVTAQNLGVTTGALAGASSNAVTQALNSVDDTAAAKARQDAIDAMGSDSPAIINARTAGFPEGYTLLSRSAEGSDARRGDVYDQNGELVTRNWYNLSNAEKTALVYNSPVSSTQIVTGTGNAAGSTVAGIGGTTAAGSTTTPVTTVTNQTNQTAGSTVGGIGGTTAAGSTTTPVTTVTNQTNQTDGSTVAGIGGTGGTSPVVVTGGGGGGSTDKPGTPIVVTNGGGGGGGGSTDKPGTPIVVTNGGGGGGGGSTDKPVTPIVVTNGGGGGGGGSTDKPVTPIVVTNPSPNTPPNQRRVTTILPGGAADPNINVTEQGMPVELLPPEVLAAITVQQIIGDSRAGPTTKQKALSTLKTIAGLTPLIGVLADAVGGGGGGGGTLDAGPGLPVGGIGGGRGRIPATFDPFTYGQREGEFEFFRNLPATTGTVTGIGGTGTTTGATGTGTTTGGTGTTGTTGTTTTGAPGTSTTATAAEVQAAFPGYTNIRQDAQGRWFGEPIPGYTASGPAPTGLRVTAAGTFNPTVDDYRFFNPGFESIEPNAAGQYVGSRTVDVPGAPGMTLEQIRAANPGYENYSVNPAGQYVGTRTTPASTRAPTLADYQAANPGFTRIEQGPDGRYYGFRNVTTTTPGALPTLDQVRAANPGYEDYGINDAGQFYGTRTVTEGPALAEGGEVDDDMVRHLIEYRKGGGHMGPGQVKGIGSGQEDKIPAWLSDGEYVWSAQDVADLGDGSTDEGVRRLDRMRKMVRQRAGRKDVKKIAKPQRGIEDMLKMVRQNAKKSAKPQRGIKNMLKAVGGAV